MCVDNEAPAGAVEQQRVDYRAEAEHPAGAGVPGASGNAAHSQLHDGRLQMGF